MAGIITTAEAAKAAGISRKTLQFWIAHGWFPSPPLVTLRLGRGVRVWTQADLRRLRIYVRRHLRSRRRRQ